MGPLREERGRRRRGGLFRAASIAALLAVGIELGLRAFWTPPETGVRGVSMVSHPSRMWAIAAGTGRVGTIEMTIDEDGLRASEDSGAEHRVLVLGDSTFFGHELREPETLHERLEAELRADGVGVEVICGGVPGYSSEQSRKLLEEVGWERSPTLPRKTSAAE